MIKVYKDGKLKSQHKKLDLAKSEDYWKLLRSILWEYWNLEALHPDELLIIARNRGINLQSY